MKKATKAIRTGVVAGICGLGLCAIARKMKLSEKVSDLFHSVEGVPFPGVDLYSFFSAKQLKQMSEEVADLLAREARFTRALDLSTGVGYLPLALARHDCTKRIVGLDRSQDMIRIARANARTYGCRGSVEFTVGSPTELPFPGRYFDLVVCVAHLHHWSDPAAVLRAVHHVLTPGGTFWIIDYKRETPAQVWQNIEKRLPLYLSVPFMMGPKASWRASLSESSIRRLVDESNFALESYTDLSLMLCGNRVPGFSRIVLRRAEQAREEQG